MGLMKTRGLLQAEGVKGKKQDEDLLEEAIMDEEEEGEYYEEGEASTYEKE